MNSVVLAGEGIAYFVWWLGCGLETGWPGFSTWQGEEISIFSKHSDWLWGSSSFVF